MGPQSSHSSRTSLVSVDPAVASHITASTKNTKSTPRAAHGRTGSTPVKSTPTPGATTAKGHGRTISAPGQQQKKRSDSLRRAKNSTEVMRLRGIHADRLGKSSDGTESQRGRNFTVTNVGMGGMLYLRPSPHQSHVPPAVMSASAHPTTSPLTAPPASSILLMHGVDEEEETAEREDVTTVTGHSRVASSKRALDSTTQPRETRRPRRAHGRSLSFSTVDESRRSLSASHPTTLKIVINRPESTDPSVDSTEPNAVPALEIPIPHYKLGTPRFSTNGTPVLRSSNYTRNSAATSTNRSSMVECSSGPGNGSLPASRQAFPRPQSPHPADDAFARPFGRAPIGLGLQQDSSSSATLPSPVSPGIYDELAAVYDDPTVVRYSHNVREMSAATKPRIIAQISSASFMDYELVSDFFLTFRSYMSTFEALDLLLARLAWAIERLTDDGRIVRIRTFAALRHWILNYFMDDFVVNRRLRVRFCEEVNALCARVKRRSPAMRSMSDLKILQDLKRCWNGRCSVYWDSGQFNVDTGPEIPLLPGGVVGSRNPTFTDTSELNTTAGDVLANSSQPLPSPQRTVSPKLVRTIQHKRLPSTSSAKKTMSLDSEPSVQAYSCSIPRQPPRGVDEPSIKPKGPHPVSVLSRRQNAPATLKVATHERSHSNEKQHTRGPGSIDSSREPTPTESFDVEYLAAGPHAGSIIRGFVYGPVEPFVQLPADPPLSPAVRFDIPEVDATTTGALTGASPTHPSPAVKNIFGSIRRALSGKQAADEVALITVSSARVEATARGKRSVMPLNVSKSHDDLRRKATGAGLRSQLRVDLLCAAAVESFQNAMRPAQDSVPVITFPPSSAPLFSPPLSIPDASDGHLQKPKRFDSHVTSQSGSILIVDDTAVDMPAMSGALAYSYTHESPLSTGPNNGQYDFRHGDHTSFETQIAFQEEDGSADGARAEVRPSVEIVAPALPALGQEHTTVKSQSSGCSTTTVKDRQSLRSSIDQIRGKPSIEASNSSVSPDPTEHVGSADDAKGPSHTLRRRPGGDLRKNQNVHDLETVPHPESFDSILNPPSSKAESQNWGKSPPVPSPPVVSVHSGPARAKQQQQQQQQALPKVSMINTHSSQHLRPSFEAAVAGFSAIPDDDDGGLEATLSKLEGRYEKLSPDMDRPTSDPQAERLTSEVQRFAQQMEGRDVSGQPENSERSRGYERWEDDDEKQKRSFEEGSPRPPTGSGHVSSRVLPEFAPSDLPMEAVQDWEKVRDSQGSIPLLQRHTAGASGLYTQVHGLTSSPDANLPERDDHVIDWEKMNQHDAEEFDNARSYLLDADERLSDLSSEITVDVIDYSQAARSAVSPMLAAPGTAVSGLEIPSHPLTHASLVNLSIQTSPVLDGGRVSMEPPLTPDASPPIVQGVEQVVQAGNEPRAPVVRPGEKSAGNLTVGPSHVPFILAYDSQMLAQQMTIVEQSALSEIEWIDLVEMRWERKPTDVLDWAEYTTGREDARGIDLVVARFNLVVKWALSEIVLTQDVYERACVISKLIHVAAHARRLHNYATMLQITIALTSTDCARLVKTWDMVSGPDKSLLKNMETQIQPVRNFHDLRVEMESADMTDGCIPFLGLYVQDLTYNSQKPAAIEVGHDHEPLINFERFRKAAVIIKGLLRLIDASTRYELDPVHGIVERCLWISALSEDRIRVLSRSLET